MARVTKPAQDLYTLEDDVYKVYNYHIEKARLGNAYTKAGIAKAKKAAARKGKKVKYTSKRKK